MTASLVTGTSPVEEIDRAIIHCLQINGRLPFRRIADALNVSEQTVARRYRRLRTDGVVRVLGLVYPASYGQTAWLARVHARPDSVRALAEALAARDDVAWVTIGGGGTEISAALQVRSTGDRDDLLLERLPRHAQVLGLSTHAMLHRFLPGAIDWNLASPLVDAETTAALASGALPFKHRGLVPLEDADAPLLARLADDGRATVAELAAATGWTQARTGRRLTTLLDSGTIYLDVDFSHEALGFRTGLDMWLTVEPQHLQGVGERIARMPEVAFCAAVTGSSNLVAHGLFHTTDELYAFLTERVGYLPGIRQAETSLVLRRVKQAGSWVEGARLSGTPNRTR